MFRPKPKNRKKFLLTAAIVLAVAGLGYAGYLAFIKKDPARATITTADGKKVTLEPATEDEKQAAEDNKTDLVRRNEQTETAAGSSLRKANIVITEKSANGVRAYVTGVFEEGGTCTATATKGGQTVAKSSIGFQNASYTQCAPIDWDTPLSAGTWSLTVTYKSATAEGVQSTSLEVN